MTSLPGPIAVGLPGELIKDCLGPGAQERDTSCGGRLQLEHDATTLAVVLAVCLFVSAYRRCTVEVSVRPEDRLNIRPVPIGERGDKLVQRIEHPAGAGLRHPENRTEVAGAAVDRPIESSTAIHGQAGIGTDSVPAGKGVKNLKRLGLRRDGRCQQDEQDEKTGHSCHPRDP